LVLGDDRGRGRSARAVVARRAHLEGGLMIGETIGHYRILSRLGAGGMGVVYKAEDLKLRRTVALKFLPSESTRDHQAKERFVREARAASALDHPNVCTIHDIDETDDGRLYIAMACYEGETIKQRLERGPLPVDAALQIATQIADGLARAHSHDIVHRDIKPANVILDAYGEAKILDFGLAKLIDQTGITVAGSTLGTVAYMAPEQARGEPADARSDVWSVGAVLYEMLTGRAPFPGENAQTVIYAVLNAEPKPPGALRAEVPPVLEGIIARCLAKDPDERYHDARELLAALRDLQVSLATTLVQKRSGLQPPLRTRRHRRPTLAIVGVVAAIVVAVVLWRVVVAPSQKTTAIDSIAVLPLANLSGDPDQEYFADGMTEALIAELARIEALRVISRTSVMRYRGTKQALPSIAADLDVDAIVEGSVLRAGDRVRITTQLIRAADDRHLWAESYERDLKDVLGLQREIARLIVAAIDVRLTSREKAALAETTTVDPAAHEAYLRGRHLWNQRRPDAVLRSTEYFQRAIDLDPDFAPAYGALASAYVVLAAWGIRPQEQDYRTAASWARKALEIDDSLAEAYSVLAAASVALDWDWRQAGRYHERALAVDPGSATAHQWYASYLCERGRFADALAEAKLAQRLDPFSLPVNLNLAEINYYARDYAEALVWCARADEIDDRHPYTDVVRAFCYRELGRFDESIAALLRSQAISGAPDSVVEEGNEAYQSSGPAGFLRWLLDSGLDYYKQPYIAPYYRALTLAWLGETNAAFRELEEAFAGHSSTLRNLAVEPAFATLRDDPRFEDLLRRMGLQE
jgi:serine/threonine-protein kinase